MTAVPVRSHPSTPFLVVVMTDNMPSVARLNAPYLAPKLSAGSSFLIPDGQEDAVEEQLNVSANPGGDGAWELRVRSLSAGRQRIELCLVNDGYFGSVYEATATTIRPMYRKITGPGFAFVFGGLALLMNTALWIAIALLVRYLPKKLWRVRSDRG
jgi:hypothetical protein